MSKLFGAISVADAQRWLRHMQESGLRPGVENFSVVMDVGISKSQIYIKHIQYTV